VHAAVPQLLLLLLLLLWIILLGCCCRQSPAAAAAPAAAQCGCTASTVSPSAVVGVLESHNTSLGSMHDVAYKAPSGQLCHAYISHAGEQKAGLVDMLHEAFQQRYPALNVFVDARSLQAGDDALQTIIQALGDAYVGESKLQLLLLGEALTRLHLHPELCLKPECMTTTAMLGYMPAWPHP
jgi:hypothetical protein